MTERTLTSTGQSESSPQYEHDCSHCTFLGRHNGHDLYHCVQGGYMPTIVARYGNDGSEYTSGFEFAQFNPNLAEARRRAKERGLPCE